MSTPSSSSFLTAAASPLRAASDSASALSFGACALSAIGTRIITAQRDFIMGLTVRLKPDATGPVRLKADTTCERDNSERPTPSETSGWPLRRGTEVQHHCGADRREQESD